MRLQYLPVVVPIATRSSVDERMASTLFLARAAIACGFSVGSGWRPKGVAHAERRDQRLHGPAIGRAVAARVELACDHVGELRGVGLTPMIPSGLAVHGLIAVDYEF